MNKIKITLRNQILFAYFFVMTIVLCLVGSMVFHLIGEVLQDNTYQQMEQTVIQASARIDALYEQIDQVSLQVMTNEIVQEFGLKLLNQEPPLYDK